MPYNTRRSLDERSFLRSRRHRRRPSPTKYPAPCSPAALTKYFVLRPHTLPSALFLPAASCLIQVLALTSSFVPRSHQFIWLTNISPTSYDALANSRCWSKPWLPCQAVHNGDLQDLQHLLSEGVNLYVATTTATPLHLAAPTPEPRHTHPWTTTHFAVRMFPSGSKYFCFVVFWVGRGGRCCGEYLCRWEALSCPVLVGVCSPFSYQMEMNCNAVEVECWRCGEE